MREGEDATGSVLGALLGRCVRMCCGGNDLDFVGKVRWPPQLCCGVLNKRGVDSDCSRKCGALVMELINLKKTRVLLPQRRREGGAGGLSGDKGRKKQGKHTMSCVLSASLHLPHSSVPLERRSTAS